MLIDTIRTTALLLLATLVIGGAAAADGRKAAVLRSGLPGDDPLLVEAVATQIKDAGYVVTTVDSAAICDQSALTTANFDLLVLPNAGPLPAKAMPSIDAYLRGGGDIIALNAPMWQRSLLHVDGKWLTREDFQRENAGKLPEHVVVGFAPDEIKGWQRGTDNATNPTVAETIADGPAPGQRALHVTLPKFTNFDTLGKVEVPKAFPNGETLTVFSAKGDENTNQLSIEWNEEDGSRWIAVVALTPEWRQYVLRPEDFRYWISNMARGFRGDQLKPENAKGFAVGLAMSHTDSVGVGKHEYWVGPIGTSKMTPEFETILNAFDPPKLDTLSPSYKLFDCTGVGQLRLRDDQVIAQGGDLPIPSIIRSPQPRPTGGGFDKGRAWRFIPIAEARTATGEWRGTPVTLTINSDGPYKGGAWASFGVGDLEWYKTPGALKLIGQIAKRMSNPVYMVDGGAGYFTCFKDQELPVGARVANLDAVPRTDLNARITIADAATGAISTFQFCPSVIDAGVVDGGKDGVSKSAGTHKTASIGAEGAMVVAELLQGNQVIDRVTHKLYMWEPKEDPSFITIKDGNFILDGKRWRAHGVNYMPSSGIGTEDGEYFEHWIGPRSYDPEIVQRDLEHIKDMGFNSVSIFIYDGMAACQNLVDILRRIDDLGMKANVGLRPGLPHWMIWQNMRKIIELNRLAENDTVFAYDIAWEPIWGTQTDRKFTDPDWEKWLIERYGSVANAEKDWKFKCPRDEKGKLTSPNAQQIDSDGPWRVMVAAYRRFLDTELYKMYGNARRLIQGLAPHHFVSFRMSEAANPNYRWEGRITYDWPQLAGGVDILEPEAYGRIGDWERTAPGVFQAAYGRWAAPQRPLLWAEAGVSTWDTSRMKNSPSRLHYAATSYENFYKLLIDTAADGVYFWWYPGGFRTGENSDFGVIEPDGTDREVTKVIRKLGPKFVNGPDAKPIDPYIEIDRDKHPDGIAGIYDEKKDQFWKLIDQGRTPGFRTAGTGTTSANCPLIAVGNTKLNSHNPPKYLDGSIDTVEVKVGDKWIPVERDGNVSVRAGAPIVARVSITNLGEAKWLSKGKGRVELVALGKEKLVTPLPAEIPNLGSVTLDSVKLALEPVIRRTAVTLIFEVPGRTRFGGRFSLELGPQ